MDLKYIFSRSEGELSKPGFLANKLNFFFFLLENRTSVCYTGTNVFTSKWLGVRVLSNPLEKYVQGFFGQTGKTAPGIFLQWCVWNKRYLMTVRNTLLKINSLYNVLTGKHGWWKWQGAIWMMLKSNAEAFAQNEVFQSDAAPQVKRNTWPDICTRQIIEYNKQNQLEWLLLQCGMFVRYCSKVQHKNF